ncbi:MAG: DUF3592 domain-containing protein [Pseudomonadota bacterium]
MSVRWLLRVLAGVALVVGLLLGTRTLRFLSNAVRVEGTVARVEARDDRCSRSRSGKHSGTQRYDCTRYSAFVRFVHAGRAYTTEVAAGKRKGHAQPATHADLQPNQRLPMLFAPDRPQEAIRGDERLRPWGGALLAFLFGAVLLLVSMVRKRPR